ncbi:phosphatidylinositol-3-phosphatase Sac1p [Trichomonascus vanleenenianus]|uniref:phosphatidylinositol-3-phosphatase SAC1 n=1 Tax=Trichomonascus vanleenenianus TaxID=2268995 RepID=UPI003EC9D8A9
MYFVSNEQRAIKICRADDPLTVLQISKPDGEISVVSSASMSGRESAVAIVGLIRLRTTRYLILCTKAHEAGHLKNHAIYRAEKFELLPLREWKVKDETEAQYLRLIENHLAAATLYFSPTWDLTNAYQRQSSRNGAYLWQVADERFFWNHYVSQDLMAAAEPNPVVGEFITPMLYGVLSLHDTTINGFPVTFGIISRRSRYRAGTRYFRRGIDEDGHVANYNETEQLLVTDQDIFSYVQTRGSVPAFWGEVNNLKYKPLLRFGASPIESARKHFQEQTDLYGKNYLVNLVNQSGYELPVKRAYETLVDSLGNGELEYVYFDFHHECSKMRWHRVSILIDRLLELGMGEEGWFQAKYETVGGERRIHVKTIQNGVVRTNCMDCLDRTNVVQSQIAKWVLQSQLDAIGYSTGPWEQTDPEFADVFRNTWADNADGVSCAYSGTGALKTDFTRHGRRTKRGALQDLGNSIVRYFKNNFYDGPRQDGYDLFLGNYLSYEAVESPFFDVRPVWTQSVPYIIYGSIIMIGAGIWFPREDAPATVNRLFLMFWAAVLVHCTRSLIKNGLQYVNWPRLCNLDYIQEVETHGRDGSSKGWIWHEIGKPLKEAAARIEKQA